MSSLVARPLGVPVTRLSATHWRHLADIYRQALPENRWRNARECRNTLANVIADAVSDAAPVDDHA